MTWVSRSVLAFALVAVLAGCAPSDPVGPAATSSAATTAASDPGGPVLVADSADSPVPAASVIPPVEAPVGAPVPAATPVPDTPSEEFVPTGGVASVIPPVDAPVPAATPVPDTPNEEFVPTGGVDESLVWVPAGDHLVPGTLTLPAQVSAAQLPVVLMLHGDLSNRNENGDLFTRQAADLAARGVASLRIDFAGSGDSEETDLQLDYPSMVADATASVNYLRSDPLLDPARVAVLGLSRGGSIAATIAGTMPGVAALVEWSGAVYNGQDEEPDLHDQARVDGYTTGGDPGGFKLSLSWFDTVEQSHPLDDVAGYTNPVLAVTGGADVVVPPEVSDVLIQTVASTDTTRYVVADADHEFNATSDDQTHAEEALGVITDWLVARIGVATPQ